MSRISLSLALMAVLGLGACADVGSLPQRFAESKAGARSASAGGLTMASVAVNTALYHLTAAFSEKLALDNQKPQPLEKLEGDLTVNYVVDADAGTATVQAVRAGKTVVDLKAAFTQRPLDGGQLYHVKSLTGTVEGYQLLLPRLTFAYTLSYDERGEVRRRENQDVVQVVVEAEGRLGLANEPVAEIKSAALQLEYPLGDGESTIGKIRLERDALAFDGEVTLANKAIAAKGAVVDPTGAKLYTASVDKAGLKLTPVQAPVPVEAAASGAAQVQ